jgi:hypothetical protein
MIYAMPPAPGAPPASAARGGPARTIPDSALHDPARSTPP